MSNITYIRCPNPKCNKMNPVDTDDFSKGKEKTCIFCGYIMTKEEISKSSMNTPHKKKEQDKRFPPRSEKKPINKNMSKPRFE